MMHRGPRRRPGQIARGTVCKYMLARCGVYGDSLTGKACLRKPQDNRIWLDVSFGRRSGRRSGNRSPVACLGKGSSFLKILLHKSILQQGQQAAYVLVWFGKVIVQGLFPDEPVGILPSEIILNDNPTNDYVA